MMGPFQAAAQDHAYAGIAIQGIRDHLTSAQNVQKQATSLVQRAYEGMTDHPAHREINNQLHGIEQAIKLLDARCVTLMNMLQERSNTLHRGHP